jgi:uncharacterized protein YidB (DUF937 family)
MNLPHSFGRVAIAAGAVLVLGGSAVGIAVAQSAPPSSTPTPYQTFIDKLAAKLGISSQTLQSDITQARQEAGLPPNGGFPGGPGRGGPGRGGFGGGLDFTVAAQAIGITPQQLRTELPGKSLAQVAQAHGKSGTDVANALKNAANQRIDQAVANGRLTTDQANTQKTNAANRIDQLVNQVMPQGGPGGRGPGGFGFGPGLIRQGLNVAAQAIGITPQQLRTELPGKSLAQVAQAHGKSGTDVANALKNAANQRIDQAVANGRLTADQANTQKTNIDNRIDQLVNQVMPQGGPGGRGNGGQQQNQTGA